MDTQLIKDKLAGIKAAVAAIQVEQVGLSATTAASLDNIVQAAGEIETEIDGFAAKPDPSPLAPPEGWTLYRVLDDTQVDRWSHMPRTLTPNWIQKQFNETSQVVPLTREKGLTEETGFTRLGNQWKELFKRINYNDEKRLFWVTANNTAWFNHAPLDRTSGWKDGMESLAMGSAPGLWDNLLACRDAGGDWLEVLTLRPDATTDGISRESTPWFVHRFTLVGYKKVDKHPYWADPKHGDCYAVLVTQWPVYIRKDWVEKL